MLFALTRHVFGCVYFTRVVLQKVDFRVLVLAY